MYKLASDAEVGTNAGWPPHSSEEESRQIITTVFDNPTTWAIVSRVSNEVIGAIGYGPSCDCNLPAKNDEPTVGYWLIGTRGIAQKPYRLYWHIFGSIQR